MGTVSDKLIYLNDTKNKLKNSINKFRDGVTNQTTFRDYAAELDEIYDLLPKIDNTDEELELLGVQNGLLDDFKMYGNTEQTTYSGINLFDYTDILDVGTGASSDNDGWITITGDNSSGSSNKDINYFTNKSTKIVSNTTYAIVLEVKSITGSGTLNLVSIGGGNSQFTTLIGTNFSNLSSNTIYVYTDVTKSDVISSNSFLRTFVRFPAGQSGSIKFRVSVIEDTTITPSAFNYEPYVGGTPSPNPDFPQDVKVVTGNNTINVHGKNLFDGEYEIGGYDISTGQKVDNSSQYRSVNFIGVKPNTTYTFSINSEKITQTPRYFYYDKNYAKITSEVANSNFTTPNNCYYLTWHSSGLKTDYPNGISNVMIEEGSTATPYQTYTSTDYSINLGSMELCKIDTYQDYIYKDNNKWYKKSYIGNTSFLGDDFSSFTVDSVASTFCQFLTLVIDDIMPNLSNAASLIGNCFSTNGGTSSTKKIRVNIPHSILGTTSSSTSQEIKTAFLNKMNGKTMICYYPLETPIYTEITDTTLIGQLEAIKVFTGANYFTISNFNNILPSIYTKRIKKLENLI